MKQILVIFILLLLPAICFGQVFPNDALSVFTTVDAGSFLNYIDCSALPSGTCSLLYVSFEFPEPTESSGTGAMVNIYCDDNLLTRMIPSINLDNSGGAYWNSGGASYSQFLASRCSGEIVLENVDYDSEAQITLIYVPYDIASSSPAGATPDIYNGFTYGEIIISIFAFLSFAVLSYAFLFFWLRGFKIKQ